MHSVPRHTTSLLRSALLSLMLAGTTATVVAQTPKTAAKPMPQHMQRMKSMPGMSTMMEGPHHALAMAYRDNLTTFVRAVQADVSRSGAVNLVLARPAAAEMRRSFDQMVEHHKGQVASGDATMNPAMMGMMKDMDAHVAALAEHLTAFETEVARSAPDPKQVTMHTKAILKECAGMSMKPMTARPARMK